MSDPRPTRYDSTYTTYQLNRSGFRKFVRQHYLRNLSKNFNGPTIDFGCGVGDLLRILPTGSIGLEINDKSVAVCRANGLEALHYIPEPDNYQLSLLKKKKRQFTSIVISHVLEHLSNPERSLNAIMRAAPALGVEQIVVVVPGLAGFRSDPTHQNFININTLRSKSITDGTQFALFESSYFPINLKFLGKIFPHHELIVEFRRPEPLTSI